MSGQANANPYQFTGRENDSPLPLYYYRNRYYSPTMSRFTTQDPIDFAGGDANLYRYVTNSPVDVSDPPGLWGFGAQGSLQGELGGVLGLGGKVLWAVGSLARACETLVSVVSLRAGLSPAAWEWVAAHPRILAEYSADL